MGVHFNYNKYGVLHMNPNNIDDRLDGYLGPESTQQLIERLRDEASGWRRAAKREGTNGFVLVAVIFLFIGMFVGSSL